MPKITTEVQFTWAEIRQILEEKTGLTLTDEHLDIKETGDFDRGTYARQIKSVTFKTHIDEKAILNANRSDTPS